MAKSLGFVSCVVAVVAMDEVGKERRVSVDYYTGIDYRSDCRTW
jgi:hypothetical protein